MTTSDPHLLSVGLVAPRGALASRIRKIVREQGCSLAFEISPDKVETLASGHGIAVVIVVCPLDSGDGSLLGRVRTLLPNDAILVCSEPIESRQTRLAMDMGVDGVVWINRLDESLGPAIHAVHAGLAAFPRDILGRERAAELTNREKQALSMVIMGLTNLEIAQKLFISENTVKSHLNTAYKKLGVHSRAEAHRLITDPDQGLGTGILAITAPGLTRGRRPKKGEA